MKRPPEELRLVSASLRRLRTEHQWTQQDLAKKSGIPQATIAKYESGRREMRAKALSAFAAAFGVSPGEIDPSFGPNGSGPSPAIARAPPDARRGPCDCSEDACRIARAYDRLSPEGKREVERCVLDNLVRHHSQAG